MKTTAQQNLIPVLVLALIVFLFMNCGGKDRQRTGAAEAASSIYAFINVNLVTMVSETILEGMTVIVRDNLINKIGKTSKVKIPKGAVEIDGTGKFLMPGLADMHVHAWSENDLLLYVANGITTIRNMWGSPMHLKWKERIANGELLSPSMITAGPLLDGPDPIWEGSVVIETPEQAAKEVAAQKQSGYDFIKIYNKLSKEAFDAIMDAAKENEIPVAGHVPYDVELEHFMQSGVVSNEHLTGYREALLSDDAPEAELTYFTTRIKRWKYFDESKIPDVASATIDSGMWICVTLFVNEGFISAAEAEERYKRPEMKYVDPITLASWDPSKDFLVKDLGEDDFKAIKKGISHLHKLTEALHKAGARILLGTDPPNPFTVPGFSIHQELQRLVGCGMTSYEAIQTGTTNAAEFLGQKDIFGTIEEGKRADLILVENDPLEDVANVAKRAGIMLRGHWFPEETLQNMLDELVAAYSAPKDRFVDVPALATEGERVFEGLYEMTYNDTTMGEERFAVDKIEDTKRVVLAQGVTDPPYKMTTSMRLEYDENGQSHSLVYEEMAASGKTQITMKTDGSKLIVTGTLVSGEKVDLEEAVAEDVLLSASMTGALIPVVEKIKKMEVGQTMELKSKILATSPSFQINDEKTTITRDADETAQTPQGMISVQVFNMKVATGTVPYDSILLLDKEGHLFSLEIKSQMGIIKFARIE
jgi:imidazolonepropionase-like amidohydrolase